MGITAENVASRFQISRQAQDEFALRSHLRGRCCQEGRRLNPQIALARLLPADMAMSRLTQLIRRFDRIHHC